MNPDKLRAIAFAPPSDSDTGSPGSDTTGTLAQARQSITSAARETAARIKSVASETASRAKAEAQGFAAEKKEDAANRIGGYSAAVHASAKSFEPQDPNIAWATHRVADRLQGLADYVRHSGFNDLKSDVEAIARRHPVVFFGGLLIAGVVVGNLLKAHRPEEQTEATAEENWDEGNASGTGEPMIDRTAEPGM